MRFRKFLNLCLVAGGISIGSGLDVAAEGTPAPQEVFAIVDGDRILREEFDNFLLNYARSKFYHRVTRDRIESLRREAADLLIQNRMLLHEAERRGLPGDANAVDERIEKLEARYKKSDGWSKIKYELPALRQRLLAYSKVVALESQIRRVEDPDEQTLASYYKSNIERFTEPPRDHLAVILIAVPPSASAEAWDKAKLTSEDLYAGLRQGADFAEVAKVHSKHASAASGGDIGFVHKGTLAAEVQKAVDKMQEGEIAAPIRVLEGFVIIRLNKRGMAKIHSFAEARNRALELYRREFSNRKWQQFIAQLRQKAEVERIGDGSADSTK